MVALQRERGRGQRDHQEGSRNQQGVNHRGHVGGSQVSQWEAEGGSRRQEVHVRWPVSAVPHAHTVSERLVQLVSISKKI